MSAAKNLLVVISGFWVTGLFEFMSSTELMT